MNCQSLKELAEDLADVEDNNLYLKGELADLREELELREKEVDPSTVEK